MSGDNPKQVSGRFEQEHNILHLWFSEPVMLRDAESVTRFFDEVVENWINKTPGRFYLLVNYKNLHIAAHVADSYSANIRRFQHRLLGTFRYGIPGDFTGVAVSLGNMKLQTSANMFEDEAAARAAIDRTRGHRVQRVGNTAASAARQTGSGRIGVSTPERK